MRRLRLAQRMDGVQFQIQFQHIDPRLAQKSQLRPSVCFCTSARTSCFAHSALLRHARNLKFRRRRRNVRIEARTRRRHQVCRELRRQDFPPAACSTSAFTRVDQRLIGGPQIRAPPLEAFGSYPPALPPKAANENIPANVNGWPIRLEPDSFPSVRRSILRSPAAEKSAAPSRSPPADK